MNTTVKTKSFNILFFSRKVKIKIKPFFPILEHWWWMNHGFLNTIVIARPKVGSSILRALVDHRSKIKFILIYFSVWREMVNKELVLPRQNFNQAFYKNVLENFRKRVISRDHTCTKIILITRHVTLLSTLKNFWPQKIFLAPPPFSPDHSPCDFFRFPKLNNVLKGRHFGTL